MQIQVKSAAGITLVPADTRLLAERKIFLEGDIGPEAACAFVKQVLLLTQEDRDAPIDLLINSCGGEINSGLLIYDAIQSSVPPIRTFCLGRAYSMGALLFASGRNGRYMLPHGELMLHEPLLSSRIGGSSSSIRSISDSLLATKQQMNEILSLHTGRTPEEIEAASAFDHYFDAEESLQFGLCDQIVGFDMLAGNGRREV